MSGFSKFGSQYTFSLGPVGVIWFRLTGHIGAWIWFRGRQRYWDWPLPNWTYERYEREDLQKHVARLQREAEDRSQYVSHLEGLVYGATNSAAAAAGVESAAALSGDAHWLAWAARADKQRCLCRSPNPTHCMQAMGIGGECACVCHGVTREG